LIKFLILHLLRINAHCKVHGYSVVNKNSWIDWDAVWNGESSGSFEHLLHGNV